MTEAQSHQRSLRQDIEAAFLARSQDADFERALGRFIIAFADAEAELYEVLVSYSNTDGPVARALFSGARAKGMIDFIRSIAHNTAMSAERKTDLEYIFAQLTAINSMRDHLVHHASNSYSFSDPLKRIVANKRASRYGNAKGYELGTNTIDAMTFDLYRIANHLNMHWGLREGPFSPWRENPGDASPIPWAYTPPQPVPRWETAPNENSGPSR